MKIIAIGDIHGRDVWKKITEKESGADRVIFIGDYLDSFNINIEKQIENFKEIVDYYYENKNKVILLMGNHDYHYWTNSKEIYSGFSTITKLNVHEIMRGLVRDGHIKLLYRYNGIMFSHAGFSSTWIDNNIGGIEDINTLEITNPTILDNTITLLYNDIDGSGYGDSKYQGPLWIRPSSLIGDMPPGFKQVVGHTRVNDIEIQGDLILIDCLDNINNYLIIEDGEFRIGSIRETKKED